MHFDVQDSLLGAPVEVAPGAIRLRPPRGWTPIEGARMDSLQARLPVPGEAVALRPLRLFFDARQDGLLAVSALRIDQGETFDSKTAYYRTLLDAQVESARAAEFYSGDLHFWQVLTQPEGQVHFRLVLDTGRADLMQFDYVVPQTHYPNAVRSIESSIGSIERADSLSL
jgi:hypothetical protein